MSSLEPLQFINLADRADAIPTVARWYYDEWGLQTNQSYENILEKVKIQSNRDQIPISILAIRNRDVVGVIQLKFEENKTYPKDTHWVGGVYIPIQARGLGIGVALVGKIIEIAKSFGVKKLYLQTEKFDGGIYTKCGFTPVERVVYSGVDVLVMMKSLE